VYIYGGLQTTATLDLSGLVFGEEVLIAGTLTVTGNGGTASEYEVNAYASEADADSGSEPIGTVSIPSMSATGPFLLGIPASDYNALGAGTDSGKKVYLYIRDLNPAIEIIADNRVTVDNLPQSGAIEQDITVTTAAVVNTFDLTSLVIAPATTATPVKQAINTTQYYGTIAWQTGDGTAFTGVAFEPSTVYKALVTLTAKSGYTFASVAADSFSYTGADTVSNEANSGAVTITFPATVGLGSVNITVGFSHGEITITGNNGNNVISKSGALGPASLNLSADGAFTGVIWYVDGESKGTSASLVLNTANYTIKIHSVTFTGWQNGSYLSSDPIPVTVIY
jgi:hypothetical protein